MSATEHQLPTSGPMTSPAVFVDATEGLELTSDDQISLQATRHVFLAADLMDPERSRDIGMVNGGEELQNPCLRRTVGRVPRCSITPMEVWVEWMPKDLFPEGMEHMALSIKGSDQIPEGKIFKPLFGYPYYPGHLIADAIGLKGMPRGIVEVETLRGVDYGKEDRELQNLFFPPDYRLPILLKSTRDHIERVADGVADPDAKDAANFLIKSCDQSREYMEMLVSVANTQLDERKTHEYTHRLTPKIRNFMAQLGIKPRSEPAMQVQEAVDNALNKSLGPDVLAKLQSQNAELVAQVVASIGPAIANAVKDAITAAVEASKSTPKATKS